jgi:heme/copper-type cytochrome/quinol oxidase subunit 2
MLAAVPWLLALVVGFFATAWIAARVSGGSGLAVLAAWFVAPYVALWFALASASDPAWEAERAAYNQTFGFVLVSILLTVPWVLVFVFAVQRGRRKRRPKGEP